MLESIRLTNYRNVDKAFVLSAHANLLVAPNGSGKSNLLESLYLISTGKVFRQVENWTELIGATGAFAKAEARYQGVDYAVVVTENAARLQRKFMVNGKAAPLSKFIGRLPIVLFAPHSVDLLTNDPAGRRDDLDDYLSVLDNQYHQALLEYGRLIKNRNALLKHFQDYQFDANQLGYWTEKLVEKAEVIVLARQNFLTTVQPHLQKYAEVIFPEKTLHAEYHVSSDIPLQDYAAHLRQKFQDNQEKERAVGQTLYGPHRDDYALFVDKQNLRYFGSRGQQRLGIFSMKMGQYDYLSKHVGTDRPPILLLDDIFSELDKEKREFVCSLLLERTDIQFILTAVGEEEVPPQMLSSANRLALHS